MHVSFEGYLFPLLEIHRHLQDRRTDDVMDTGANRKVVFDAAQVCDTWHMRFGGLRNQQCLQRCKKLIWYITRYCKNVVEFNHDEAEDTDCNWQIAWTATRLCPRLSEHETCQVDTAPDTRFPVSY